MLYGDSQIAGKLLEHGADANLRNIRPDRVDRWWKNECKEFSDYSPLDIAVIQGNIALFQLFMRHDADVNAVDPRGNTALHKLAQSSSYYADPEDITEGIKTIKMLRDSGADISPQNDAGNTPLHIAAMKGTQSLPTESR